ncbi:MAG: alpha-glucan family phosphorylase [Deltaproteobacteria bacterium]|nr:alpha-glucan family phosphorylase [Deltaproteobacteria bacterium]
MKIESFVVLPDTPEKLKCLNELAYNLYFSWTPEVLQLFEQLDPELWTSVHANPVRMLSMLPQETLNAAVENESYLVEAAAIYERFRQYMDAPTWHARQHGPSHAPQIAYFSAEFAFHESLPTYSGGLGVLAGDHMKTASDLGVPLVGVGLLYRQGYFQQSLTPEGIQQEEYLENDWHSMPVRLVTDAGGKPIRSHIPVMGDTVHFQIWRVDVGRTFLLLLDSNLHENAPKYRDITKSLYDPSREIRLQQEMLLGIGGVRALQQLGYAPGSYHINEGHSAFLLVERIRQIMQTEHLSCDEAREIVWATSLFTTHTPVAAGNERFAVPLLQQYFSQYAKELQIPWENFLELGREPTESAKDEFCMTVLALRLAAHANGVSQLHGAVSRHMWRDLYPNIPEHEIPIGHIVNGVHTSTWLNGHFHTLLARYVPRTVPNELIDLHLWEAVEHLKDEDLWDIKELLKVQLVDYIHERLRAQYQRSGLGSGEQKVIEEILQPHVLTIGFARRFTAYKRAYLLFSDPERLRRILCNPASPVQVIIAGKAHPADQHGKEIIQRIHEIASDADLRRRIVFVENYDINVAQHLVQGVDVWLNTPLRPQEASGTSGMKAAMNGGLNLSVLDGWWDEAFVPECGWAIGGRERYADQKTEDAIESRQLYRLLENNIIPLYYDRDKKNLPRQWIEMMRTAMRRLGDQFNANRMVEEYFSRYYRPMLTLHDNLTGNGCHGAKELHQWRTGLRQAWPEIAIADVESDKVGFVRKGDELTIRSAVRLGSIPSHHIRVECYHGPLSPHHEIVDGMRTPMALTGDNDGIQHFTAAITCTHGGRYGYTVRVIPGHTNLATNMLPGLITWYE